MPSDAPPPAVEAFDLKSFLAALPTRPGVYRMYDAAGTILYVGKARHLKNRVSSYFQGRPHADKTQALVAQVARVEVTVTTSEIEALLLEYNLIKQHRPRYNVLLKDDKSFPFIRLSTDQAYPRLSFYRGARRSGTRLYGPYPSAAATRETLLLLARLFRVRQCEDTYFANRSRPCLQYQIERCTGPCVGLVSPEDYARDVQDSVRVLEGRNAEVVADLGRRMEQAAATLEFEQAARLRDQIQMLKTIQSTQSVSRQATGDVDAVALAGRDGEYCVAVAFVRGGRSLGSSNYFPRGGLDEPGEVLAAFLSQYYLSREAPDEILLEQAPEDAAVLEEALSAHAGHPVRLRSGVRGARARWLEMARSNAALGLQMRAASRATLQEQLAALVEPLGLARPPQRLECFDVSHTMGEAAIASCVVFGPEGPLKSDYRRFKLREASPGDDYAGMREAVARRYARVVKGEAPLPDLLLIDGGAGQLREARAALAELGLAGLAVLGVAKGADRRAGQERLFLAEGEPPLILPPDSPALRLIQRIRDEAHRFAITGHRQRREKTRRESVLEDIAGLGPKRRRELLKAFGGLQGLRQASVEDLARVHGIGRQLAEEVYERLNVGTEAR